MTPEMRGPYNTSPTDYPTSLTYGKYDDLRMPWVGRFSSGRVFTVTDVSMRIAEANENRVWIRISNIGSNPVCIGYGETAVFDLDGDKILANGNLTLDRLTPWAYLLNAVCGAGLTTTLLVNEVSQVVQGGRGE